jgi:hypothetical protein
MWAGLYTVISRANAAIANVPTYDASVASVDELLFNDVSAQAHFIRAWSYFSLVRLFGDVPLWTELPSSDNFMIGLSSAKEVYAQIIMDAEFAANNMNGATGSAYVQEYAAHMLLAKVYMTLATNIALSLYQKACLQIRIFGRRHMTMRYRSMVNIV